ncbi:MAG: hypothetical protein ABSH21_12525 [Verrucomicrobiia bacterium]
MAVNNNCRDITLTREPFHFVMGFGIQTDINFVKGNVVLAQVLFGVHAPATEVARVNFDLFHGFFL